MVFEGMQAVMIARKEKMGAGVLQKSRIGRSESPEFPKIKKHPPAERSTMTQEQFQKANELSEEIKSLESFKKAFNNEFFNAIKAANVRNGELLYIKRGDELHTLINEYLQRQIEKLKTEFENL